MTRWANYNTYIGDTYSPRYYIAIEGFLVVSELHIAKTCLGAYQFLVELEVLRALLPTQSSLKRLTGTKDVLRNPHMFPSFRHYVLISSEWASANDTCLLNFRLCQICLLNRIMLVPRDIDCSRHSMNTMIVTMHSRNLVSIYNKYDILFCSFCW